ncbi:hypothetical protein KKG45_03820 [bacterium]|nr:hypothetical protein [bacterium]MBU1072355.1 hypothetical protein [bacterium]MBU1675276.1 hypothetical protein [bacterium]
MNERLPEETLNCLEQPWPCQESCSVRHFELLRQCDVRGLLHCHTAYVDGAHDLAAIVGTARELGLDYLGVTDKLMSDYCADGLCAESMASQRAEIEKYNADGNGFTLLHGVEVEVDPEGNLPVDEELLAGFDYVVATMHHSHDLDRERQTTRALRAVKHPRVSILGHPIGHFMTTGRDLPLDIDRVLTAASAARVAVEIDANPAHEDLDWKNCYHAQKLGVILVIASDAHRAARLCDYRHGAEMTRDAGLCCRQILNTQTADEVRAYFTRAV